MNDAFKKYALAGPEVMKSPSHDKTCLALVDRRSDQPSPTTAGTRASALEEPSKKGLSSYDKMMGELEATLKKFLSHLDKSAQAAVEASEKEQTMKEQLERRLQKKRAATESAAEKGRQAWFHES